ncbi:hypothetical protein PENTCL1PPCAC_6319, partial [Pristionchus entomophagus]
MKGVIYSQSRKLSIDEESKNYCKCQSKKFIGLWIYRMKHTLVFFSLLSSSIAMKTVSFRIDPIPNGNEFVMNLVKKLVGREIEHLYKNFLASGIGLKMRRCDMRREGSGILRVYEEFSLNVNLLTRDGRITV